MIGLLATLVIYQHANILECNTVYQTRRLFTGVQASYTPVDLYVYIYIYIYTRMIKKFKI